MAIENTTPNRPGVDVQPPRRRKGHVDHPMTRIGRPPRLSRADEFELYCYRKSGIAIKTCASMWRVSVPTANRIIAKFRAYEARVEPVAREFRERVEVLRNEAAPPGRWGRRGRQHIHGEQS